MTNVRNYRIIIIKHRPHTICIVVNTHFTKYIFFFINFYFVELIYIFYIDFKLY